MRNTHAFRANDVTAALRFAPWPLIVICALVVLPVLFLPACGGGEPTSGETPAGEPAGLRAQQPAPASAEPAKERRPVREKRPEDTMDLSSIEGRERDGAALAATDNLRPDLTRALPPVFPDDIPLGNWLSVSTVRLLGEQDFVLSCSTSYRREAVGEFFVRHMPEKGWTLVNRSSKPILSVITFRKDERTVTVMVKKQVMNEDVAFDLSYKAN